MSNDIFNVGHVKPCWENENLVDGPDCKRCMYIGKVKNDDGKVVTERRKCPFKNIEDFQDQMDKRRQSLKRAIDIYAKTGGRSTNEITVPAG